MNCDNNIKFTVTGEEVIIRCIYDQGKITTTIKMHHKEFILLAHNIINKPYIVEGAISRAPSIKGKCVTSKAKIEYSTNRRIFSIKCIDTTGNIIMQYEKYVEVHIYESAMINIIRCLFNINRSRNQKLYIVYDRDIDYKNDNLVNAIISGKVKLQFASSFCDALKLCNSLDTTKVAINTINYKEEEELFKKLVS